MKYLIVGISIFILLFTFLPAASGDSPVLCVDIPRISSCSTRCNVQLFGEDSDATSKVWVQAHIMIWKGNTAGLVFRSDSTAQNYYAALLNSFDRKVELVVYKNGRLNLIKSVHVPNLSRYAEYELWAGAFDNRIVVYLDGEWLIDYYENDNTSPQNGLTGITTYHKCSIFSNLLGYKYE
jgi:hypothetical protein